jgi:hypothetical protein
LCGQIISKLRCWQPRTRSTSANCRFDKTTDRRHRRGDLSLCLFWPMSASRQNRTFRHRRFRPIDDPGFNACTISLPSTMLSFSERGGWSFIKLT